MEESVENKRTKERSPTFPFITLERALDRARQFYAEEKRGISPFTRAVRHWNYSEASSGALQTVAALKSYGLMEDAGGSGISRQLKLTDLALRILLDQRPDSMERADAVREAALTPSVANDVYDKWPDGLPSESTVNHFLVYERRFSEETAIKAMKILKENQGFAKIDSAESLSSSRTSYKEPTNTTSEKNASSTASIQSAQRTVQMPVGGNTQLMLKHRGVTISMTFSEEPSQEIFEYLEKYAAFEKHHAPMKTQISPSSGEI